MQPSEMVIRILKDKERLRSQGKLVAAGVSKFDKGDPDFKTPAHICDAAREAMNQGYTHYVPGRGDRDLIGAICDHLRQEYACAIQPEGVIITHGGAEGIFLACSAYLSPGDELIIFTPGYSSYAGCAMMVDAVPVWVRLGEGFRLDQGAVERAINKKTRAILFCNPNNPTGTSFTQKEIESLAELALKHDLLLISDEVYKKLYYDDKVHFSMGSIPEIRDRTIIIDSFSKTYAMTGWRIGYLATTPRLAEPPFVIHKSAFLSVGGPTQRAALAALRGPQDCVRDMLTEYNRRRKAIIKKLGEIHGFSCVIPDSTFYFFGQYDADMKSAEMVDYLYDKGVAVRSGTEFGESGEGWIRLSYSVPYEEVVEGMDRLAMAFKERG
jgi:aspartate/methionine/tyrosine aminotransferase